MSCVRYVYLYYILYVFSFAGSDGGGGGGDGGRFNAPAMYTTKAVCIFIQICVLYYYSNVLRSFRSMCSCQLVHAFDVYKCKGRIRRSPKSSWCRLTDQPPISGAKCSPSKDTLTRLRSLQSAVDRLQNWTVWSYLLSTATGIINHNIDYRVYILNIFILHKSGRLYNVLYVPNLIIIINMKIGQSHLVEQKLHNCMF